MLHDIISGKDNNVCEKKKKIVFRFEWKKKKGKKWGGVSDSRLDVRKRGGGHSDAYCVQQGGWGV